MIRGTTPTHKFVLPFDVPEGAKVIVVYSQMDNIILEKKTSDCSIEKNIINVSLTDQETLKFNCNKAFHKDEFKLWPVEIQIGIETIDGTKMWSNIMQTDIERCLKEDGVI